MTISHFAKCPVSRRLTYPVSPHFSSPRLVPPEFAFHGLPELVSPALHPGLLGFVDMPERMLNLFLTTFHFPASSVNYGVRQYRLKPREGIGPRQVCRLAERPLSLPSCRPLKMSGRQVFRRGGIADGKVCYGQESLSPARGERIVALPGRKWKSADGPPHCPTGARLSAG